ncbi:MAG: EamA family transporter [Phycisphaerae bacterium]|nr:EamA family transporter [Phycisphaerae bacterium]
MWLYLGVFSALFLGLYDISKKHSLQKNAVLPVLFFATIFGAVLMVPGIILSGIAEGYMKKHGLYIPAITLTGHLHIFAKSAIVSAAWVLGYFALKNLPISIATPITASGPLWVLLGATVFFREHPTFIQYLGLATMVVSYYLFSIIGNKEGIRFGSNKWVVFILLATLINTCSALYDKFLIQTLDYTPLTVQAWFSVYLVAVMGAVVFVFWLPGRKNYTPFVWRWSIPLIGLFLIVADFAYFKALAYEGSLIAMLSTLRCGCILVSFLGGILLFKELRPGYKAIALCGVLAGVFLILSSQ